MGSRWLNRSGKITVRTLLWLFVIAAIVYVGIKLGSPYLTNYMLKIEVEGEAKTAHVRSDHDIVKYILEKTRDWELPIEEKDIVIERREGEIEISILYKVEVNFFNQYTKTLFFNIHTVKTMKTKQ